MTQLVDFGLASEETKGNAPNSMQLDATGVKVIDPVTGLPARSAPEPLADGIYVDDPN